MPTPQSTLLASMTLAVVMACADDSHETPRKPQPVIVNYESSDISVYENGEFVDLRLVLSSPAQGAGTITMAVRSETALYNVDFTTEPAVTNEQITLPVATGQKELFVLINLNNDGKVQPDVEIDFEVVATSGLVSKGEQLTFKLKLQDDELLGKPKSLFRSGVASLKKTYEYDDDARLSVVHWESKNPFVTVTGADVYSYDDNGHVISIKTGTTEYHYTWENNQIKQIERLVNGRTNYYAYPSYNDKGWMTEYKSVSRRWDAEVYQDTAITTYSYYEDGNLHTSTSIVNSTITRKTTYTGYTDAENAFHLIETLPGLQVQPNLPAGYIVESGGQTQEYTITYTRREDGLAIEQTISGPATEAGSTTYTYY